jgi:integrase
MANIRRRGSKWQVQVRRQGFPSRTRSFNRRDDAKAWARAQELAMDRMEAGVYQPATETLGSVLSEYLVKVTPAKKSAASEKRRINRLMRDPISHHRVCDLTPEILAGFRDRRLEQGLRASGYDLQIIRHALNVAISEWGLTLITNPVNKIRMPPKPKARERRLKPGEYELLLKHARLSKSWFLEPLIILGVETGMRLGEMLKLRWEDWDSENQTLHLRDTKNGLDRLIPINTEAAKIVSSLDRSDTWVMPTNYPAVKSAWARLCLRADISDLRFHDLRHEAISRWIERGFTVSEVALISGHKSAKILLDYAHARLIHVQQRLKNSH